MTSANLVSTLGAGKYFKTHYIDNLEKIQDEVSQWFWSGNNLSISQSIPLECLDSLEYTSKELRKIGIPLRLTYWVIPPKSRLPCHIDGTIEDLRMPMPICRFLIPVINCLSTETIFYKDVDDLENFTDDRASVHYVRPKNREDIVEDEKFILDHPTWMRIDKLHAVVNHSDQLRVSFAVFYDKFTQLRYAPRYK
jgi:hypothetical protein